MDKSIRGQSATEYLMFIGVAVIIALVAISLLGGAFKEGAAQNQNDVYWQSTGPITIKGSTAGNESLQLRIQNTGQSPVIVKKIISGNSSVGLDGTVKLQPGEETTMTVNYSSISPSSICDGRASRVSINTFGFGYTTYIDGTAGIEKTQVGKVLMIPCNNTGTGGVVNPPVTPPAVLCGNATCSSGQFCCADQYTSDVYGNPPAPRCLDNGWLCDSRCHDCPPASYCCMESMTCKYFGESCDMPESINIIKPCHSCSPTEVCCMPEGIGVCMNASWVCSDGCGPYDPTVNQCCRGRRIDKSWTCNVCGGCGPSQYCCAALQTCTDIGKACTDPCNGACKAENGKYCCPYDRACHDVSLGCPFGVEPAYECDPPCAENQYCHMYDSNSGLTGCRNYGVPYYDPWD